MTWRTDEIVSQIRSGDEDYPSSWEAWRDDKKLEMFERIPTVAEIRDQGTWASQPFVLELERDLSAPSPTSEWTWTANEPYYLMEGHTRLRALRGLALRRTALAPSHQLYLVAVDESSMHDVRDWDDVIEAGRDRAGGQ